MEEILYISDTFEQSEIFLQDLIKKLTELKINFKFNKKYSSVQTEKYKLLCLSINSCRLGTSHHLVKYFMNFTCLSKIHFNIIIGCRLKESVKEIKSINNAVKLLMESNEVQT